MRRSFSIILVLVSLLAFGHSQAFAKETWTRVQSKNFTLVGNASERDIRKIALKLEIFRETLSLMFPRARISTPIPTTVVIFKSDDSFRPFKPRYQGKIRDNVGGYFIPDPHMNYIALSSAKEFIDPDDVIFHEYEHFLLQNNLLHIPTWLDEGLAEFYSSFQIAENNQEFTIGIPLEKHVYYLRDHPLLPLKTLVTVDHKSPQYNEGSKVGAFYAESWALVHYLMNGNAQKRQPQLIKFIDLTNAGTPAEEAFQKAFQTDFKTLEAELSDYVRRFQFNVLNGKFRRQVNFEKEMQATTLSEAESQYYGGDLLLHLRQLPEAGAALQKSLTLDPHYAPSLVSLGIFNLFAKRTEEARKLFQSAMESDPTNYLAHYYNGEALSADNQYAEALESYKKAVSLKPDLASLYAELGYAYLKVGNEEEAANTFQKGVQVNPREAYFYRSLAYLHLTNGLADAAAGDAYSYLTTKGWRDEHSQYLALVWYFALRKGQHAAFATKILQDAVAKLDSSDWPYPVVQFLNHTLTETEMLAQANNDDKLTEAHAYAGLELSLNGDSKAALEHLRWVKDKGNRSFVEYGLAMAELDRLEHAADAAK
ncbi:MAG TPA: tetratricopeptide repeat protein [Pyrinomonadaceae bacterium]|nr:tetratricopeptide repeat protein [Pyrinomonadaceae bacterium]